MPRLGKAAVSFGDVGRNRKSGAVQLVDEKTMVAGELFGLPADGIREIHGLLKN